MMTDEFTETPLPEFFHCWVPDYGETRGGGGKVRGRPNGRSFDTGWALDAGQAAEKYVGQNFAGYDYPEALDVMVAADDGPPVLFCVDVESEPVFSARRAKVQP